MIEFAVLSPLLVALFLGTWSFGYSCYVYSELEGAVRSGARFASLSTYDAADPSVFTDAVKNAVVYGHPEGGTQPLVSGLLTSHVNVSVTPHPGQPVSVKVSISGYKLYGMYLSSITLRGKPNTEFPFLGHYVPVL